MKKDRILLGVVGLVGDLLPLVDFEYPVFLFADAFADSICSNVVIESTELVLRAGTPFPSL